MCALNQKAKSAGDYAKSALLRWLNGSHETTITTGRYGARVPDGIEHWRAVGIRLRN